MATRLDALLEYLTPALDHALRGEGVPFPTPGGVVRIRQASGPRRTRPPPVIDVQEVDAGPEEPTGPTLVRDRAEEVVVGFSPRPQRNPPPPPRAEAPDKPEREGFRRVFISQDEPTRQETLERDEVARRVSLDRVQEVLAMAPGGAASASELAAWFGVPTAPMEKLMRGWCEVGTLAPGEGDRYLMAASDDES